VHEIVRVFNSGTLVQFGREHSGAEKAFRELNRALRTATWRSFQDVAVAYPPARAVKGDRVVFNIKGNEYRVVAAFDYGRQAVFIKFVGTHAEYDKIDAETVNRY
jgi:mRNA interferase HigB